MKNKTQRYEDGIPLQVERLIQRLSCLVLIEAAVCMGLIIVVIVLAMWATSAETRFHQQAVESGHAEWVAQPDGSSEFRWLPPGYPQIELGEEVD